MFHNELGSVIEMWKLPDSKPHEITQVDRPEIETETPHPDVPEPQGGAPLALV